MPAREYNFDGLVGPTHNYGGLSPGNLASSKHAAQVSNPREAALQGLAKIAYVHGLGAGQAVLPPHVRPSLRILRRLGFAGTDERVLADASEHLLRLCSSAAAMWAANAATCAPSADTADGRMHLTPANLQQMFHRSIEPEVTYRVFKAIFADPQRFAVHSPLPGGGQFADEGAANHSRLITPGHAAVHLFAWGRSAYRRLPAPKRFPARQTYEASQALARLHQLEPGRCLFPRQRPDGIDAGAFHSDVLSVGNQGFLMLHERAFANPGELLAQLRDLLGPDFAYVVARERELSAKAAVAAYPFNSQVLELSDGSMAIVAPRESQASRPARSFLERVVAEENPVRSIHYLDLRQSMKNGGGPACLRLRVWLTEEEVSAISGNVLYTPDLHRQLEQWIRQHYRDRLVPEDLRDPALARESMTALDELSRLLQLGNIYDFQL